MRVKKRKIVDLIFAEYNPRQLSEDQFQALKDSLTRFGFVDPVVVNAHKDRANIIVGGHQRVRVAQQMGLTEVPTVEVDLPLDKERELNIRLNKNVGGWDWDALANNFDIAELSDWGFTADDLQIGEQSKDGLTDPDDIPDPPEPLTRPGDLFELGDHRLLCGDCTRSSDIQRLMGSNKYSMVSMDPPYGKLAIFDSDGKNGQDSIAQCKNYGEYEGHKTFDMGPVLAALSGIPKVFILWGGNYFTSVLPETTSWLCWDKSASSSGGSWFSEFELAWTNLGVPAKMFRHTWQGMIRKKEFDEKERVHPPQKPIALYEWQFTSWTKPGEIILEMPIGSGSSLIACEKTGRKCYGMEIDPHYCDVTIKRWEAFTGKTAKVIK